MAKNEKTSSRIAKIASRVLKDKRYGKDIRALAASALTQTADKSRKTGLKAAMKKPIAKLGPGERKIV